MICDANVVLRYILEDIPVLSQKASELIENEQIFLPFEIIAEVVYVLEKVYGVDRDSINDAITGILRYPNIETVERQTLEYALSLFSESRLDFVDTLLCGYCYAQNRDIETFDKKLRKRIIRIKSDISGNKSTIKT